MTLLAMLGLMGAAAVHRPIDSEGAYVSNGSKTALVLQRAQISLEPPELLPLGGYTARQSKIAEPGGETLFARIAILSQGPARVALVSVEMLTVPESLAGKVREKLPQDMRLFLVATHTHCAPDSQMLNSRMTMGIPGIATYKEKWLDWYAERIAAGIQTAQTAPKKNVALEAREFAPGLNRARRQHGFPDPWVRSLSIRNAPNEGLVSVYAAHATIYDDKRNQSSGDWPGAIAKETGAIVFPGAIGDVSPAAPDNQAPAGEKITAFVRRWLKTSTQAQPSQVRSDLEIDSESIDLQEPDLHPDFARANGIPTVLAKRLLLNFAPREASVTAVRIGDVVLLGIPGEPTSHVGWRIAEIGRRAGLRVWPISHCNGWMGYIVDPADYLLNGYEATLTMYGPGTANRVTQAAERLIARMSPRPKGLGLPNQESKRIRICSAGFYQAQEEMRSPKSPSCSPPPHWRPEQPDSPAFLPPSAPSPPPEPVPQRCQAYGWSQPRRRRC